jgi:superoxide dismutase
MAISATLRGIEGEEYGKNMDRRQEEATFNERSMKEHDFYFNSLQPSNAMGLPRAQIATARDMLLESSNMHNGRLCA